jgi:hypothetical protein
MVAFRRNTPFVFINMAAKWVRIEKPNPASTRGQPSLFWANDAAHTAPFPWSRASRIMGSPSSYRRAVSSGRRARRSTERSGSTRFRISRDFRAFAVKRQHHQEVHVGVRSRVPISVGTKKDDSLRLELASDPLAQVNNPFTSRDAA